MAVVDSPAHLLSLKVMRVSRPEVSSAWQPFFSSSPYFSAHASASILSLQGNAPLPGHPKTLRDLTHASDILTLPSSFGSIQLGQTFASCLCVNNEAPFTVDSIRIRVEMQTITAKTLLYQTPEPGGKSLSTGDTLECIIDHEIKELGQHVLACAVTYRLPPNIRPIPGASEDSDDPTLQTFRKFYKFIVTNPLAVKTKVHSVRSPTALLTPSEREKIFLEVHIQNVTQETMHFERLSFEPTEEWEVQDPNVTDDNQSIFSGSIALMNPQDVRQYVFILSPTSTSILRPLAVPTPGSIFPLGRLNIIWRSLYGEPGRLLTSTLTRRIPLINPGPPVPSQASQHPASALPPHLKRAGTVPSRPQSPNPHSRPGTPPPRRPQSPTPNTQPMTSAAAAPANIEAHLTLREPLPSSVKVEEQLTLGFTLHVNMSSQGPNYNNRPLLFVIQHVLPSPPITAIPAPSHLTTVSTRDLTSPRASLSVLSSGFSTPTASGRGTPGNANAPGTFNYTLARQKLLVASSRSVSQIQDFYATHDEADAGVAGGVGAGEEEESDVIYPPPYPLNSSSRIAAAISGGTPIHASHSSTSTISSMNSTETQEDEETRKQQLYASYNFDLTYIPTRTGFYGVGGVRILYLGEGGGVSTSEGEMGSAVASGGDGSTGLGIQIGKKAQGEKRRAQIIKEYEVIAELMVSS
ncbi:hypothetical protein AN958_04141 [Leucoagaricus sp. SymC.cos]|nr:hypothetical protein AN958_04141 [Leucoagaricus sp. SymC.cos]